MRFAAARALFLASLFLCFLASASQAGTVTGTVRNGTTGKPAAGVEMILIQLQGGMQPVANTKTDSQGHYSFNNPSLGAGPMLIRAVYRGVNYHEPATPGKTTVDIEVFEPTDKPSAFSVTAHAIIVQPSGSDLLVNEEYVITNKTQPPVAFYRADGSFIFSLPEGAQLAGVSAVGSSGMPVTQNPIDKGKNEQAVVFPFRPGDSDVRVSYKIPYTGDQTTLRSVSRYSVDRLAVFAPPSVKVAGSGFSAAGTEQGFSVYMRESVAANAPVSVSISGTAPAPAADSGAAGGAGGAPGGDDSQNPSVNSRADTGATTPVASVTSLPARLDSLKWILVAGFVGIFALGLAYLWRQPQIAPAAHEEAAAPPQPKSAKKAPPASAQPPTSTAAKIDREVAGSLDQLKDTLFRLELRREAGTISQEEYAREHDRVQKVLRDLVKG